ncbi:MAG: RluA family pseudouridine synthase [candidate division Zixibacteria bacterium]|nr:RluA family pseudouridine synthase [candidate division Zixibacteria bacterium]
MPERISFKISKNDKGERLDKVCTRQLKNVTRSRIKNLIDDGNILVNGMPVKSGYMLKTDDILDISLPDPEECDIAPENIPIEIVFQDKDIVVINKAAGMVVHPAVGNYCGTLVNALLYHIKDLSGIGGSLKPGIVHRLDKNTTGLLVVAKNDNAHLKLANQIKEKTAKRLYKAIVIGDIPQDEGELAFPIGRSISDRKKMSVRYDNSREAVTQYKVLERFGRFTFLELRLQTGRTHQIRVHLSHSGYPVLGDPDYNGRTLRNETFRKNELDLWRKILKINSRQMLHAYHLEFNHPVSNDVVSFNSNIPADFREILELIRTFYKEGI